MAFVVDNVLHIININIITVVTFISTNKIPISVKVEIITVRIELTVDSLTIFLMPAIIVMPEIRTSQNLGSLFALVNLIKLVHLHDTSVSKDAVPEVQFLDVMIEVVLVFLIIVQ